MGDSMGLKASQAAQLFGAQTPMGRSASAEEIANVVCFLLSDASSYMTGACVPVDGGYLTLGTLRMPSFLGLLIDSAQGGLECTRDSEGVRAISSSYPFRAEHVRGHLCSQSGGIRSI
jgi:hypothetical protein